MHYLVILLDNRNIFDHFDPFWLRKRDWKNFDNFFSSRFPSDLTHLPSLLLIMVLNDGNLWPTPCIIQKIKPTTLWLTFFWNLAIDFAETTFEYNDCRFCRARKKVSTFLANQVSFAFLPNSLHLFYACTLQASDQAARVSGTGWSAGSE